MYKISSQMRVYTNRVSLHKLLNMIEVGRFEPSSYLMRPIRWNSRKKSQIIESIILGLPCEEIWAEEDLFGRVIILSGVEFVSALIDFRDGKFRLGNLSYLKELEGAYFGDLNYSMQDDLFEADLNLNILHHDSNPLLKCAFLKGLNKNYFGRTSNQLARNFSFIKAEEELRKFSIRVYEKFIMKKLEKTSTKSIESFVLAFQEDLVLFLLLFLIKNDRHHNELRFEDERYDMGFVNLKLSFDDNLSIALDKLMMRINEHDDYIYKEMYSMFSQIENILEEDPLIIEHTGVMNRLGSYYRRSRSRDLIEVLFGSMEGIAFKSSMTINMLVKRINL